MCGVDATKSPAMGGAPDVIEAGELGASCTLADAVVVVRKVVYEAGSLATVYAESIEGAKVVS